MATVEEAQQAILDKIAELAPTVAAAQIGRSGVVLQLAEAWAWLDRPAQPHGGATNTGT